MRKKKLIESWKDLVVLLIFAAVAAGVIYAIFFTPWVDPFTTGTWSKLFK